MLLNFEKQINRIIDYFDNMIVLIIKIKVELWKNTINCSTYVYLDINFPVWFQIRVAMKPFRDTGTCDRMLKVKKHISENHDLHILSLSSSCISGRCKREQ